MKRTAIVTGGEGGLGRAIVTELRMMDYNVVSWDIVNGVDVTSAGNICEEVGELPFKNLDVLVNCAGVATLSPIEKSSIDFWNSMAVNAYGILNTTRELLPMLHGGTICNIVSDAAHRPMTYSLPYNASKAAALMMTKQMARELKKTHDITVFSVSPNRMKCTGMSASVDKQVAKLRGWTDEEVMRKQSEGLASGMETDPAMVAEFVAFLLSKKERHIYLNGCDMQYGC